MSSFVELQILKEEEKVLMNIASRLSDQLNRLKVKLIVIRTKELTFE